MSKILLSADSTCDLSKELAAETGVIYTPLHIILNDQSYDDSVNITPDEIYQHFDKTGTLPKTSAVNTDEYIAAFQPYVEQGYDIIHINIGSALSSSYANCVRAAEQLGHIYPIDSCNLSTGTGHIVLEAYDRIRKGLDTAEIVSDLKALVSRCHSSFVIDKLNYLRAGGRCSTLAMLGANLLSLKPCIEVDNQDGSMTVGKKYRGKFDRVLIQYVHEKLSQFKKIKTDRIFITHAGVEQQYVTTVKNELEKLHLFQKIYVTRASCTISSHCGPGTLGILFMTES